MEIKSPLVSIVVPTYKPRYFEAALQSALLQTYQNIEILISDDCPAQDIQDILSRYLPYSPKPVRVIRNKPGLGGLMNYTQCVTEARGQFVKFLNDDDILMPTCVERMIGVFLQYPSVSLVTSRRLLIDGAGRTLPDIQATRCPFPGDRLVNGRDLISYLADYPMNFIGEPSTVMFRREHLVDVKPNVCCLQGETIRAINDLAMYVNVLTHGDFAYLVEPLSCFRQHEEQRQQQSDILELWKKAVVLFTRQIKAMGLYRGEGNDIVRASPMGQVQWKSFDLQKVMGTRPVAGEKVQFSVEGWVKKRTVQEYQQPLVAERLAAAPVVRLGVYVLGAGKSTEALQRTLASLAVAPGNLRCEITVFGESPCSAQMPANVRYVLPAQQTVDTLNECIQSAALDWVILVENGVEFTPGGLHMLAVELSGGLPCDAVYADELARGDNGVLGALFRPDFNLDLTLSLPSATARHWLFRTEALQALGGFDASYSDAYEFDFIVRLLEERGPGIIGHLDEPLLIGEAGMLVTVNDEVAILERHLQRRGYPGGKVLAELPGRYRLVYGHDEKPMVSIIVPTKDQLPMLLRCVTSLLEKTRYPNFEVLIVDNDSETPEAREWLDGVDKMKSDKVRVLRYPHPFNYSAVNNMAAREARGEYLVLLNNDTAILREDWLDALMNHGQRPEVGIVGAKLLYPNGKIQHAGVILGLRGPADHPFIGREGDDAGYMQRMQVDQNLSAVTAACLLIRKSVYDQVGGLDESFKVSYNDVDLCLKVREAGYLIVWTPHSVVMHVGNVSQNLVDPAKAEAKRQRFMAEQDAMYEKWLPQIARDPAYNPNLSLGGNGFEIETDANLTWRPLSWRPLPIVLAHMADVTGCGQYRVIQPFNAAKEAGLIDGTLLGRLLNVPELERYSPDAIVLQRQVTDVQLEIIARTKKFSRAFKVFELDDYLPNLPLKSVHRAKMPKDIIKSLRRGLSLVDRFVVSTEPLAEAFAGMHGDIRVVRNTLNPGWWHGLSSERRVSSKPRVGWAGGSSHTGDLEMIADVVRELANEVEWVFFGMCPDRLRPYVHEFHPGIDIEQYPAALARLNLDLAIAPVEQNLFNECKSNLRLLEYGACGFPVVCSDLVCYQGDLPVTRVRNRFKDWVDAIRMHLADLDATAKMGDELRAAVCRDWMLEGENLEQWRNAWLP